MDLGVARLNCGRCTAVLAWAYEHSRPEGKPKDIYYWS